MLKVTRRMLATVLIMAAATACSLSVGAPAAHASVARAHAAANPYGWPFCCPGD